MTLLQTENLEKSFQGLRAVDEVDLAVDAGEIVGLIGPNGAGKTTLFNCITGVMDPDAGTVRFDGEAVTGNPPHELARQGLVRTFQQARAASTLTVEDNVKLAAQDHPGERTGTAVLQTKAAERREAEATEQAAELLEFFDLAELADEYPTSLSGGQRKLLELTRSLMLEPDLLLLDEPFAGVNPTLTRDITDYITRLNDDGMTFFVIEHDLETLSSIVDRLVVLHQGTVLATGAPSEVLEDEQVIDAYLGESVS